LSRTEQDREDLIVEATALVERAELAAAGFSEPVVIGFRADGCASLYFGPDPAWHFNTRLQLRRAYIAGVLYKAERGQLVSLERRRTAGEVQLVRDDLKGQRQNQVLSQLAQFLAQFHADLQAGNVRVLRQVPADSDLLARIRRWLDSLPQPIEVALSPHAR
jgi:hypothetical protein